MAGGQPAGVRVADRHLRALLQAAPGGGAADPGARRGGDHHDLPGQQVTPGAGSGAGGPVTPAPHLVQAPWAGRAPATLASCCLPGGRSWALRPLPRTRTVCHPHRSPWVARPGACGRLPTKHLLPVVRPDHRRPLADTSRPPSGPRRAEFGDATARGRARRAAAELPRTARAGAATWPATLHRPRHRAAGPGGGLVAEHAPLGARRARRAVRCGATLVPVNTRFTGPEALDVICRSRRPRPAGGRTVPRHGPARAARAAAAAAEPARPAGPGRADPASRPRPARQAAQPPAQLGRIRLVRASRTPRERPGRRPGGGGTAPATSATSCSPRAPPGGARARCGRTARRWTWPGPGPSARELTRADRYLVVNPFFHTFGYKAGILACLLTGATMVPQLVFDAGAGDGADRDRADHRVPRRADDLHLDARPPRAGAPRPVQPAARGHRRGGRAGRAGRADAGRAELRHRAHRVRADRGGRRRPCAGLATTRETVASTSGRATAGFEVRSRAGTAGRGPANGRDPAPRAAT